MENTVWRLEAFAVRVYNRREPLILFNDASPKHQFFARLRAVAQERSFTRATARVGVSPSALGHTIRALEGGSDFGC